MSGRTMRLKNRNSITQAQQALDHLNKKQEFILVSIFSLAFVFGILLWMETLTCGWHLTDDHEFVRMLYAHQTEGKTFRELCREYTLRDLGNRFRPLYMPTRVFSVFLFRDQLLPYYVMKGLEAVACLILLYYVGRQMSDSKVASMLFSLISLTGYQSVAWWKLGTHEMQGTLLLAASWLTLMWWIRTDRRRWCVVSVVSAALMMLYKESYLAMGPFLLIFAVYFEYRFSELPFTWRELEETLEKRKAYLLAVGLLFVLFTGYFVFVVGIGGYDLSGDQSKGLIEAYWAGLSSSCEENLKWYFRFGILFVAILLTYWEELKKRWKEAIVILVFIGPQIVFYGRDGFKGHYLLPFVIAFALFFVLWTWDWKVLSGKRRWLYIVGIVLVLAANGRVALREADYFRLRGEGITTAFETIEDLCAQRDDVKLLCAYDINIEANMTLQFWMANHGIDDVYYWNEESKGISNSYPYAPLTPEYEETCAAEEIDIVIAHNREDRHWYYDPTFDVSEFTEIPCGTMTLYVRNDAGLEIPSVQVNGLKIHF